MKSSSFKFDNTYARLPAEFYRETQPEKVSQPNLIAFNKTLAKDLGICLSSLEDQDLGSIFSGNQIPAGACSIAMAYAGHQFGNFVPQLGDGRAILLGELVAKSGHRFDIQLKGSGRTPFSRGGDGRSAIGPVIREYILSEGMFNLGVPTTRALAAVATGDSVQRESFLPGGVFTRVAASHIRVGSFEYFAARGNIEHLTELLKYSVQRHYPELLAKNDTLDAGIQTLSIEFLKAVIKRQACLLARWMSLGFIHGVMNTDNTSVAGITIDYGPCAFMDNYQSSKVFSSIDRHGRYSYEKQPNLALWNMERLAVALLPLVSPDQTKAVELLESELALFAGTYEANWLDFMGQKIGLVEPQPEDRKLIDSFLCYMEAQKLDFTLSFRKLSAELVQDVPAEMSQVQSEKSSQKSYEVIADSYFERTEAWQEFVTQWKIRLQQQGLTHQVVVKNMHQVNPIYIPRNHQVEKAIQAAQCQDYKPFHELNHALQNPFKAQAILSDFSNPPLPAEVVTATFCGT